MDEATGATIIPFPAKRQGDVVQSTERLAAALTSLSAALTEQRNATQRWRDALLQLSERMRSLGATPG